MKQGNVFTFGDIMGLRRRIKNKIKSIFFGSKGDEDRTSTGTTPSNVMYETPSSPIKSNQSEEFEEKVEDPKQNTEDHTEDSKEEKERESEEIEYNKKEELEEVESEENKKEENAEVDLATLKVIDEQITTSKDSEGTGDATVTDIEQDVLDEKSTLQNLFNDEDIEQAVFIYNVSKLDMTHCPNCNEEIFGNWTYEEGKYLCSSCQSVLA